MRTDPAPSGPPADRIILLGTGETAVATLWRLVAAGAHVRWYVDHADLGAEIVLANALGGGRLELCFGDAHAAPLDGAAAIVAAREDDLDPRIAERARAQKVPVHIVGPRDLAAVTLADLGAAGARRDVRPASRIRDMLPGFFAPAVVRRAGERMSLRRRTRSGPPDQW